MITKNLLPTYLHRKPSTLQIAQLIFTSSLWNVRCNYFIIFYKYLDLEANFALKSAEKVTMSFLNEIIV